MLSPKIDVDGSFHTVSTINAISAHTQQSNRYNTKNVYVDRRVTPVLQVIEVEKANGRVGFLTESC